MLIVLHVVWSGAVGTVTLSGILSMTRFVFVFDFSCGELTPLEPSLCYPRCSPWGMLGVRLLR